MKVPIAVIVIAAVVVVIALVTLWAKHERKIVDIRGSWGSLEITIGGWGDRKDQLIDDIEDSRAAGLTDEQLKVLGVGRRDD